VKKSNDYGPVIAGSSSSAPATTLLRLAAKRVVEAGSSGDYPKCLGELGRQLRGSIGRGGQIRTADPRRPRRIAAHAKKALFSGTSVSSKYGHPVEAC
jgi:hypothetical protein